MISIYKSLVRPCLEYASHVLGGSTHTALLNRVESKAIRLINSSPLTDYLQPLKIHRNIASLAIFYGYSHAHRSLNLLTACLHPTRGLAAHDFHSFSPQCCSTLLQEWTSILSHSVTGDLWNRLSTSVFPSSFELNSVKRGVSRHFWIQDWLLSFGVFLSSFL